MPRLLKIRDLTERGVLAFDLRDLVALIPSEGERLAWCAFPMGEPMAITGDLSPVGTTAEQFEQRVDATEAGVMLCWQELVALGGAIHQTIWGTFLGCEDPAALAGLGALFCDDWHYLDRATAALYQAVEIGLQAVDSSFWLVYAKDDAVLERIRRAFTEVEVITVG